MLECHNVVWILRKKYQSGDSRPGSSGRINLSLAEGRKEAAKPPNWSAEAKGSRIWIAPKSSEREPNADSPYWPSVRRELLCPAERKRPWDCACSIGVNWSPGRCSCVFVATLLVPLSSRQAGPIFEAAGCPYAGGRPGNWAVLVTRWRIFWKWAV